MEDARDGEGEGERGKESTRFGESLSFFLLFLITIPRDIDRASLRIAAGLVSSANLKTSQERGSSGSKTKKLRLVFEFLLSRFPLPPPLSLSSFQTVVQFAEARNNPIVLYLSPPPHLTNRPTSLPPHVPVSIPANNASHPPSGS